MQPVILYLEDDEMSREVMEFLMVDVLGYTSLVVFPDSEDFMNRLEALPEKPNLFLLDIHMEPIDGFGVIEQIRSHPDYATVTVVALTASVMNEEVAMLKSAGFNGCIAKPVDQDSFPKTLQQILNGDEVWRIT